MSYRNQSIDLLRKSRDWFLYDISLRHERVNENNNNHLQMSLEWERVGIGVFNDMVSFSVDTGCKLNV